MRDFGGETLGEDLDVDGRITLEWVVKKSAGGWTRLMCFRKRFHKMREISFLPHDLLASQKGPCSMELIKIWETGMGCEEKNFVRAIST